MSVVGFTGTQNGMTDVQKAHVRGWLYSLRATEFHHGDCIRADAEAHAIATRMGINIVAHPGFDSKGGSPKRAGCQAWSTLPAKSYRVRNADIVRASNFLIAAPRSLEVKRSGTWMTIRMARKAGVPLVIIYPNGEEQLEGMPESNVEQAVEHLPED